MMGTTRIIAIRHGETDWNVATRIQGHTDIGLNDTGRQQAERVGRALAGSTVDAVYASDLQRALHTAQAIARNVLAPHAQLVRQHAGLRERAFGSFEGHTFSDIEARWPQDARRWKCREPDFAPPGGESPLELMARVEQTTNEIAARHAGQHIVLVSHGGVLDMLYRLATRQRVDAARTWELGNTAINRLLWTPAGLTLVGWADTRHLDEPTRDESSN